MERLKMPDMKTRDRARHDNESKAN